MNEPPDKVTFLGARMHPESTTILDQPPWSRTPSIADTPIGKIAALSNGMVAIFREELSEERSLTPTEAWVVIKALMGAAGRAEDRGHEISGFTKPKATQAAPGLTIFVTCRGHTRSVRLSKLRKLRRCTECKLFVLELWIDAEGRNGGAPLGCEICEECMRGLLNAARNLRALPKPEGA